MLSSWSALVTAKSNWEGRLEVTERGRFFAIWAAGECFLINWEAKGC